MPYEQLWRNKWLTAGAASIEEMADLLQAAAEELRAMAARGVRLDGGQADDFARLVTDDPAVAREYGFDEEEPEDEDGGEEQDEDPEGVLHRPARGGQVLGGCVSGYTAGPRAAWQDPENGANT